MSHVPSFGRRGRPGAGKAGPAPPPPSPPSRSKRSTGVRLTVMAGAGAAALGISALSGSCTARFYDTLEQCLRDGRIGEAACSGAFAGTEPGTRVLFRDAQVHRLREGPSGQFKTPDGTIVDLGLACGPGQNRLRGSSSSRSYGGYSSSSSSSGSGWSLGRALRGGFGGTGHAYSGGGG
jgi:hypothetical protein